MILSLFTLIRMRWALYVCLGFCTISSSVWSAEFHLGEEMPMEQIRGYGLLQDQEGSLDPNAVVSGDLDDKFVSSDRRLTSLGITDDGWWIRFAVENAEPEELPFVIHYPFPMVDLVDFYLVDEGKVVDSVKQGEKRPRSEEAIGIEGYGVEFMVPGDSQRVVYMRIQNPLSDVLDSYFEVGSPEAFEQEKHWISIFLGFILGGGIIILIYNAVIWAVVREQIYGWYVAYLALALLTFSVVSGFWHHFIWVHQGFLSEALPPLLSSLTFVFLIQFSRHFLLTHQLLPRIDRIMKWGMLSLLLPPILFFSGYSGAAARTAMIFVLVLNILPVLGIYLWRKGNQVAKIYAVSWAIWVAAICGLSGRALGWFPTNDFTLRLGWLGIWGEAVLFALALVARIRILQQEKLAAEARAKSFLEQSKTELEQLVTERTRDLENKRYELEVLNSEKDKFFSIIAHDLRNPFRGIFSLSEILAEDWRNLPPEELQSSLDELHDGAERLNRLLENLLSWAQLQKGSLQIKPQEFPLEPSLKSCVELFRGMADQKQIELNLSVEPGLVVLADEPALETVIRNLLNNALKYSEAEGKVEVSAERRGASVVIEVEDSGVGMEESKVKTLLTLGEQESTPGTSGEQGSGLGLLLCKELVTLQSGRLAVKSEIGRGTRFTVELPAG